MQKKANIEKERTKRANKNITWKKKYTNLNQDEKIRKEQI